MNMINFKIIRKMKMNMILIKQISKIKIIFITMKKIIMKKKIKNKIYTSKKALIMKIIIPKIKFKIKMIM